MWGLDLIGAQWTLIYEEREYEIKQANKLKIVPSNFWGLRGIWYVDWVLMEYIVKETFNY